MSKCQYAVPFVLRLPHILESSPEHFMLHWSLRSVTRDFSRNEDKPVHKTMVDVKGPLISCLSLGQETATKLRVLNEMLSPEQNTFWHEWLPGGHFQQKISQELTEIAWYLPGGYDVDTFSEPVGFINIRGNALEQTEVPDTLIRFSSVTCIFTSKIDADVFSFLMRNCDDLEKIILVVKHEKKDRVKIDNDCDQLKEKFNLEDDQILKYEDKEANFDILMQKVKQLVTVWSEGNETSVSELVSNTKLTTNISIDDQNCLQGVEGAANILLDIDELNKSTEGNAKSLVIPCQSDIATRRQMAKIDKEVCRQKDNRENEIEKHKLDSLKEKWKLQKRQLQYPVSSSFMKFLKYLSYFTRENRSYFLQALKLGLNER